MNLARPEAGFWTVRRIAWALGLASSLAVLLTIGDPGMTLDEPLDVRPGRTYVETLQARGWRFFERNTVDRVFRDNCEHPPLGRWLLGIASKTVQPIEFSLLGRDPLRPGYYILSGRVAPALCFGAMVGLVAASAGRRYGRAGGAAAGFSLAIMPRVFAHAHLAALDTFVALFWTLALLKAVDAVGSRKPIAAMGVAGLFWGLALLTKIHGWFLAPVVAAWALTNLPLRKALPALILWTAAGLIVFVAGWPWLWYDSWDRIVAYVNTGLVRTPIRVLYFGRVYLDRDVPWHYPWVYLAVSVPVGLHLLGVVGCVKAVRDRDRFLILLMGTVVGWLVLFSTRVPVYDGERLFLAAFPLWAILIGRGLAWIWDDLAGRARLRAALMAAVLAQVVGAAAIHPFGLSYYNAMVGGLWGAERLGLELTFWGDSVDGVLVDRLARDVRPEDNAALAPSLVPGQGKVATTRHLADRGASLGDQDSARSAEWVVVWRREAYWSPEVRHLVENTPPVLLRSRQGVWLSGLWRRPTPQPGPKFFNRN